MCCVLVCLECVGEFVLESVRRESVCEVYVVMFMWMYVAYVVESVCVSVCRM